MYGAFRERPLCRTVHDFHSDRKMHGALEERPVLGPAHSTIMIWI
jgi:hypothetical protein